MKFYQIKAIRKNIKPPVWRRILVPANITFSQLAVILEGILEIPPHDTYMFESYSSQVRFSEYKDGKKLPSNNYYSAYDAAENYINEYFDAKNSFSFTIPDMKDVVPGYRLEIEKSIEGITLKDKVTGDVKELVFPLIEKQVFDTNDDYFSSLYEVNEIMRRDYFIVEEGPSFDVYSEVHERIDSGKGILYSNAPVNRRTHVERSFQSYFKEFAENFELMYENQRKSDHYNNDSIHSGIVNTSSFEEQHSNAGAGSRHSSLEGFLEHLSYEDLMESAEEINFQTAEKDKRKLAKALAERYLSPDTMKRQLLWATEDELDIFEEAIKKRDTFFKVNDWKKYDNIYMRGYYLGYSDDYAGVTGDIADAYEVLKKSGFRSTHRQARWLRDCLGYVGLFYAVMPIKKLYRIFSQKAGMDIGIDAFRAIFHEIPQDYSICSLVGDKVVENDLIKDDRYKKLEKRMLDIGYYIPSVENIEAYSRDRYPSDVPQYIELYKYFIRKLKWKKKKAAAMCTEAARGFSYDEDVPEYLEELYEKGIPRDNPDEIRKIMKLVIDVYNNTRNVHMHGHTTDEVYQLMPQEVTTVGPTGSPVNPIIGNVLNTGRGNLEKMGVNVVSMPDSTKTRSGSMPVEVIGREVTSTKKVYPNDPCPCGSGKKYKKCCGRNANITS